MCIRDSNNPDLLRADTLERVMTVIHDLLAIARRRVRRIPQVQTLQGTAQRIPLPDSSVDVAHARWAYFFGPGCEPGLAELARVVRRGGTAFVIDNDPTRSTFGRWFRRGYPHLDPPEVVERFWSTRGWTRTPVDIRWSFADRAGFEAVVRIGIFVGYLLLVSRSAEIRRVFQYHGAEHKTIYAYEAAQPLTLENVRAARAPIEEVVPMALSTSCAIALGLSSVAAHAATPQPTAKVPGSEAIVIGGFGLPGGRGLGCSTASENQKSRLRVPPTPLIDWSAKGKRRPELSSAVVLPAPGGPMITYHGLA